ncbi:hypothetical protein HKX48_000062 [Thoreauomyces humboldtii]|nr:hypothetical protein HKX48_000062 [Thoreauomyces humboldtii]
MKLAISTLTALCVVAGAVSAQTDSAPATAVASASPSAAGSPAAAQSTAPVSTPVTVPTVAPAPLPSIIVNGTVITGNATAPLGAGTCVWNTESLCFVASVTSQTLCTDQNLQKTVATCLVKASCSGQAAEVLGMAGLPQAACLPMADKLLNPAVTTTVPLPPSTYVPTQFAGATPIGNSSQTAGASPVAVSSTLVGAGALLAAVAFMSAAL